ncbi:DUF3667 domain-containing protein [Gaetbulibacter sp. M235]|uniref:DUF3667 domain-containing protein n=1 Tax=Gaetbulibacter sp. M235 TaxID=3126510 RepID=UPI00374E882F
MQCNNCNTTLSSKDNYCNNCGAKVIRNRLALKNLFSDFIETYLNYDNKFIQTFINLFIKPEDVIGNYITGTRKKYVNVISYFTIAITISGLYLLILKKGFPESLDFSVFNTSSPGQAELQKRNISIVQEYQAIFMMLYVPVYAIIGRLTFIGINKYNYTELLVVFIYIQAQLSITSAVLGIIVITVFGVSQGVYSLFALPFMILYSAYSLRRLYELNYKNMVLRTLWFLVILIVFFIALSLIMGVIMFLNGDLQP